MPQNFFFAEQTFFAQICVFSQSNLNISLFENILRLKKIIKFCGAGARTQYLLSTARFDVTYVKPTIPQKNICNLVICYLRKYYIINT